MSAEDLAAQPEHSPPPSSTATEQKPGESVPASQSDEDDDNRPREEPGGATPAQTDHEPSTPTEHVSLFQREDDDADDQTQGEAGGISPAKRAEDPFTPTHVSASFSGSSQNDTNLSEIPTVTDSSLSSGVPSRSASIHDLPATQSDSNPEISWSDLNYVSSSSDNPPTPRSDSNLGASASKSILKPQKKTPKAKIKSVGFVDVTGSEVKPVVAERVKQRSKSQLQVKAFSMFSVQDFVQLFFIGADGTVHAQEDTTTLHFVRLMHRARCSPKEDKRGPSAGRIQPPAFLHIGDWLYPLFPGCSPVLITAFGTYIFPDLRNNRQGAAVALVLPQYVTPDERERFETLLEYYGSVEDTINRVESYHSSPDMTEDEDYRASFVRKEVSAPIIATIKLAAFIIVTAIKILTQFGEWLIHTLAGFVRSKWHRASYVREVNPHILRGVLYVKSATNTGVIITNYVAQHLEEGAINLSRLIAPRPSVIPGVLQNSSVGKMVKYTASVSFTAYGGVAEVYRTLSDAATILLNVFSEETVRTMEYRYGKNYAHLTKEAFGAAINVKDALSKSYNLTSLAFVPSKIGDQVSERFHDTPSSPPDLTEDRTRSAHAQHPHDEESVARRNALRHAHSSGHSSSSLEDSEEPKSRTSVLSMSQRKKSWLWSSTTIEDQVLLETKLRGTDSESRVPDSPETQHTADAGQRSPRLADSRLSILPEEAKGLEESIDHFHPLRRSSSGEENEWPAAASARTSQAANSRTSLGAARTSSSFSVTRADSSTRWSESSLSLRRRSSGASGPTRRQSVYLSYRKQSMHVNAAMGAAVERQYSSAQGSTPLLAGCHLEGQRNRFRAAAICITRAKIRRRHREMTREKFLVVVRLSVSLHALRRTKSGHK